MCIRDRGGFHHIVVPLPAVEGEVAIIAAREHQEERAVIAAVHAVERGFHVLKGCVFETLVVHEQERALFGPIVFP